MHTLVESMRTHLIVTKVIVLVNKVLVDFLQGVALILKGFERRVELVVGVTVRYGPEGLLI